MRLSQRLFTLAAVATLAVPGSAGLAQAAVPSNDTWQGATAVTALPTTITQDTTGATTDSVDASLNCGAPNTGGSVWFKYTATADGGVMIDPSASGFSVGFFVTEGDPTLGGNQLVCAPGTVGFATTAGQTYYIVAFSDTVGLNGGALSLTFSVAPPPPTMSVTVNPKGTAYKDGSATITGTYTCSSETQAALLIAQLNQKVGRVKISGSGIYEAFICDGQQHDWAVYVESPNGLFAGGKAASTVLHLACGVLECVDGYVDQDIQLTKGTVKPPRP